jgi:hypothetical protein
VHYGLQNRETHSRSRTCRTAVELLLLKKCYASVTLVHYEARSGFSIHLNKLLFECHLSSLNGGDTFICENKVFVCLFSDSVVKRAI